MDALLGIVLVAQLPSKPAEVVFQHPPASAFFARPPAFASAALATEKVVSGMGSEGAPSGAPSFISTGPAPDAVSVAGSGAPDGADRVPVAIAGSAPQSPPPQSLAPLPLRPLMPPATSGQDLRAPLVECFGVPSLIFAKLMLPDEELCNRPLYLEIDAGAWQTTHRHESWSHLLFASFPCTVEVLGVGGGDAVEPQHKVQRFNVVHILDSRLAGRRERHAGTLWQVSAHLARAIASEEARDGFLSREVRRLLEHRSNQDDAVVMGVSTSSFHSEGPESGTLSLDKLLTDAFEGVLSRGFSSLRVNGSIFCQVSVFPTDQTPAPPSAGQALALTCAREELEQELPIDAADIVRSVVEAVDPRTSLGTLMVRLALPLGTLQRVAQHLVFWKKALVVEVFQEDTRVVVTPGVDMSQSSKKDMEFMEWQRQHRKGPQANLSFSEVITAFSGGKTVCMVRENLRRVVDFNKLLEWMLAQGLLIQLATFYHFLPGRAKKSVLSASDDWVSREELQRLLQPQELQALSREDLRLLASRASDEKEMLFLCRFVCEFARRHCRADGSRFTELAESIDQGRSFGVYEAKKLVKDNKDIFVPYVCRG